jgi:hypothetical protein
MEQSYLFPRSSSGSSAKGFQMAELKKPGAIHIELVEDVAKLSVPDH